MEPLHVTLAHPMSLVVQLPEGCSEYDAEIEGEKGTYAVKVNVTQYQFWIELAWIHNRRRELNNLRQGKEIKGRTYKDGSAAHRGIKESTTNSMTEDLS